MSTRSEQALPYVLRRVASAHDWRAELSPTADPSEGSNIRLTSRACQALSALEPLDLGTLRAVAQWTRGLDTWGLWGQEAGSRTYAGWGVVGATAIGHALMGFSEFVASTDALRLRIRAYLAFWALGAVRAKARAISDEALATAPGILVSDDWTDGRVSLSVSGVGQRAYSLRGGEGHLYRSGMVLVLAHALGLPIQYDEGDWYHEIHAAFRWRWPLRHPYLLEPNDVAVLRRVLDGDAAAAAEAVRWIDLGHRPWGTYTIRRAGDGAETALQRVGESSTPGICYAQQRTDGRLVVVAHDSGYRDPGGSAPDTVTPGRCELSSAQATVYSERRPQRWAVARITGSLNYEATLGPDGCRLVASDGQAIYDTIASGGGAGPPPAPSPNPEPPPAPGVTSAFRVSVLERPDKLMLEVRAPEGSKVVRVIHGGGDGYGVRIIVEDQGHAP